MEKAHAKAETIKKAVEACRQCPGLSGTASARTYKCSKSIVNMRLHGKKAIVWLPDHFVKRQKLTPFEKIALNKHIGACYQSGLPLHVEHLNSFANEILMNNTVKKGYNSFDPVNYN